ncbi:MAG: SAS049 family protein [Staphylococcus epidermidis]|nr:SAS049 family protein [Staphylococcus epidermidis]
MGFMDKAKEAAEKFKDSDNEQVNKVKDKINEYTGDSYQHSLKLCW